MNDVCKDITGQAISGDNLYTTGLTFPAKVKGYSQAQYGEAATALLSEFLPIAHGMRRGAWSLTYLGKDAWEGEVSYVPVDSPNTGGGEPPAVGDEEFSGSTSGATTNITQAIDGDQISYGEVERVPEGQDQTANTGGPDRHGAIGYEMLDNQINIRGADVPVPALDFQITKVLPSAAITMSWLNTMYKLTATVNNRPWRGFAPGEILFRGVDFSAGGDGVVSVIYLFSASPTFKEYWLGEIFIPLKKGWYDVSVQYTPAVVPAKVEGGVDTLADSVKPEFAQVSKVLYESDLNLLGV